MSESEPLATTSAVVAAVAAAAAGATGHPVESILGAGGATALQPVLLRGLTWAARAVRRGADKSGRTVEELVTVLDSSPVRAELLIKALELARSSSLEAKREAIADALARGAASEEAAVGESEFLRILADLDIAHVEALRILSEPRPAHLPRSPLLGQINFEPEDLGLIKPALAGREHRLLAVLSAHGLAERDASSTFGALAHPTWNITPFGRHVLDRFRAEESPTAAVVQDEEE